MEGIECFSDRCDAAEFRYRVEFREIQHSVRHDKREFVISLVGEAENGEECNHFKCIYRIMRKLAYGRKSFIGPVKSHLKDGDEELKRKEHRF